MCTCIKQSCRKKYSDVKGDFTQPSRIQWIYKLNFGPAIPVITGNL